MLLELDNEIVRLAQSGSTEAFGVLVNHYEQQVYRLVRIIAACDRDAEELLEATFLRARENLAEYEGEEKFYTWLARIAVHAAVTRLRPRHPFTRDLFDEPIDNVDAMSTPGRVQEWVQHPRRGYRKADLDAILSRALEDLDAPLRIVFALGDIEKFSLEEIANILGLSVTVARTYWMRARLRLRSNLSVWFENLSVSASY